MEANFMMTPEAKEFLCGPSGKAEYVVCGPVNIEFELKSGEIERPQEMRERITRCRDCAHAHPCPLADSEELMCALHDEMFVNPDDFCSWGEPRGREADD